MASSSCGRVDREMFKMRELRGAGMVEVNHIPTDKNPFFSFGSVHQRLEPAEVFEQQPSLAPQTARVLY